MAKPKRQSDLQGYLPKNGRFILRKICRQKDRYAPATEDFKLNAIRLFEEGSMAKNGEAGVMTIAKPLINKRFLRRYRRK